MIGAFINHLWQSTWFAAAAALLALALRKRRADIRFWLWLSASCKFLLPFSLLLSLGGQVNLAPIARRIAAPSVSYRMVQISQPFSGTPVLPPSSRGADLWTILAIVTWASGFLCVALFRFRGWRRVRAAVRASAPMSIPLPVEVRSCPGLLEPGVVGLFYPVLLLPADIGQRLTPPQLDAVLAHELCHIRRRDNLAAAVHMVVEAVFWFYPLVWWIGTRLMDERERACDEEVLRLGNAPNEYAEGILNVCKSYVQSPLGCVTGVTGSDLKARIHRILAGSIGGELDRAKRITLAVAGIAALAAPVLVGMISESSVRARSQPPLAKSSRAGAASVPQAAAPQAPQTPKTKAEPQAAYLTALGSVAPIYSVTVRPRVEGQLMSVPFKEGDLVQAGQVLATIDPKTYELQLAEAEGQLNLEQARLSEQAKKSSSPQDSALIAQLNRVDMARANVERAKLQVTYTRITAPIAGIIGLRRVDPGNIVHPDATLAVINQLQPISVVFDLPEDDVPQVLALLRHGANVPVEAWNRDDTVRHATGRLAAIDNQIDQSTGTVKLKATFDNQDGALFPNQFVIVHLTLKPR